MASEKVLPIAAAAMVLKPTLSTGRVSHLRIESSLNDLVILPPFDHCLASMKTCFGRAVIDWTGKQNIAEERTKFHAEGRVDDVPDLDITNV